MMGPELHRALARAHEEDLLRATSRPRPTAARAAAHEALPSLALVLAVAVLVLLGAPVTP